MVEFTKEQRMQIIFNDIESLFAIDGFKKDFLKYLSILEESGATTLIDDSETIMGTSRNGVFYRKKIDVIKELTDSFEKFGCTHFHRPKNGDNPIAEAYASYIAGLKSLGHETPRF